MKRIIGLVLIVLAIAGTVNVVRKFAQEKDNQTQPQTTDNSAYNNGKKAGKYSAPVVLVLLGIWGLRLLLSSEDSSRPSAPAVRRSPTNNLPPPGHPSLRGGQDTFASNPAMLNISAWQWLAANPWVYITAIVLGVIGIPFLLIKLPVGIVLLLTAVILLFQQLREARQKFFGGDVCPGIVLSAEQNLVAIYAELGTGNADRPYPAIQIMKQPLQRMTTGQAYDGMRVATVALYAGNVHDAAWKNFEPEVINCVVHDTTEIERVLGSIPELDWRKLDVCLAQIPVAKLGLHHISPACLIGLESDESNPPHEAAEAGFAPARPWFKSPAVVIGFAAIGLVVGLILAASLVVALMKPKPQRPYPDHRPSTLHAPSARPPGVPDNPAARPPQSMPGAVRSSTLPTETGPYAVNTKVEADLLNSWIPGKITQINPGGFSVMVRLEDKRFPQPIVLSTNQIRLK